MSFTTIHSNRVETLKDQLIDAMASSRSGQAALKNPLAKEYVLVDNRVLGDWVNLQIAQAQGIAANIHYIQPHQLFWELARQRVSDTIPKATPLSKQEMTWKLYALLDNKTLLKQQGMAPVAHYLEDAQSRALKRYQLAANVADLFDQYLVYRPEWIRQWSAGKNLQEKSWGDNENSSALWQSLLWKQLYDMSETEPALRHRAAIEQTLLETLAPSLHPLQQDKGFPMQRLFVFGMTSMSPKLVDMLLLLGKHIDVTVFVLNPCREYWSLIRSGRELARQKPEAAFDEEQHYEVGNPLLASQGVQVRDFISLLQHAGDDNPAECFDEIEQPETLLQSIQCEIRDLHYKGKPAKAGYVMDGAKQALPPRDGNSATQIPSVHIHSCHSVMREVEVLHDQIRDILKQNSNLDNNSNIHPRDIVVMMPRVAPYVASIHAVFNSVEPNKRIPYHITDRSQSEESPLLHSLATLLKLPESRLPLSEVLSLLEVPAIQRRFGIDYDAYVLIKRWLVEAGVRWGIDAQHRSALGLPPYSEASWEFAFSRLMAGYAIAVDSGVDNRDSLLLNDNLLVQPYDLIEGNNSQVFDALLQFWKTLQEWRALLNTASTPKNWADKLRYLLDAFFEAEQEQEHLALKSARSSFHLLDEAEGQRWFSGELPLAVIRDLIQPELEQAVAGQNHWREGVKFCSLMPMRGVPFKVVYILGMNLEDYPRRIDKRSYDLMRSPHRAGDRASRIDDRWLFLEALLSARQYFHVSYIGRDVYRNEKREPSVVLAELIDYCRHGYDLPAHYLQTEHPLQPFSEKYFYQDKTAVSARLVSYNQAAWSIVQARRNDTAEAASGDSRWHASKTKPDDQAQEIRLNDFIRFFTRPQEWYFSKRHKVWLDVSDDTVSDEENFGAADYREDWHLYSDLIAMVNQTEPTPAEQRDSVRATLVEQLAQLRRAEGRWPLGMASETKKQALNQLKTDYLWFSQGKRIEQTPLHIGIGKTGSKITLVGELPISADGRLLIHSASKLGGDKEFDFDIRLAVARKMFGADGKVTEAVACFRDREKRVPLNYILDKANDHLLDTLASLYVTYQDSGLPFDLSLSETVAAAEHDEDVVIAIESAWITSTERKEGMVFDSKQRSYFGSIHALDCSTFRSVSTCFWSCLNDWRNPIKELVKAAKKGNQT